MKPEILSSEKTFKGWVFDLSSIEIRDGDSTRKREIIEHDGSVVIAPIFEDKAIIFVRQY